MSSQTPHSATLTPLFFGWFLKRANLTSHLTAGPHWRLTVGPGVPGLELAPHVGGHQLTGPGEGHRSDGATLRLVIHLASINQSDVSKSMLMHSVNHLERALAVPHQDVDPPVLAPSGDVVSVTGEGRGAA